MARPGQVGVHVQNSHALVLWHSAQQPADVSVVFGELVGYMLEPTYVVPGASMLHDPEDE